MWMVSTTPEACAARSAPRTARTVPSAWVRDCQTDAAATMVETFCGMLAWPLMDLPIIFPMNRCHPKMPPMMTATASSTITIAFVIAGGFELVAPSASIRLSMTFTYWIPCSSVKSARSVRFHQPPPSA